MPRPMARSDRPVTPTSRRPGWPSGTPPTSCGFSSPGQLGPSAPHRLAQVWSPR
jgi:hypothetical protein